MLWNHSSRGNSNSMCKVEVCSIHSVFFNVTSVSCKNGSASIPPHWHASAEWLGPQGWSPLPGPDQCCSSSHITTVFWCWWCWRNPSPLPPYFLQLCCDLDFSQIFQIPAARWRHKGSWRWWHSFYLLFTWSFMTLSFGWAISHCPLQTKGSCLVRWYNGGACLNGCNWALVKR